MCTITSTNMYKETNSIGLDTQGQKTFRCELCYSCDGRGTDLKCEGGYRVKIEVFEGALKGVG